MPEKSSNSVKVIFADKTKEIERMQQGGEIPGSALVSVKPSFFESMQI